MNKKNTPKGVIIMSTFKRILSFVLARVMVAGMLLARCCYGDRTDCGRRIHSGNHSGGNSAG